MGEILIVDDDPGIVEACKLFLERVGHEVHGCHSRAEGELALERESYDLLVLDVMMDQPDDGLAMAQALRRRGYDKPVVMVIDSGALYDPLDGHLDPSGTTQAYARAARSQGAEIYLRNPVNALTPRPDGGWPTTGIGS